ncbi:HAMP domain-containing protein [Clostridium bovifaecis]|uniref:histidine kinase n=1 Tax=Clostridium bovifaecis TaxID=2184719 RepID=A0A6I6F8Y6_9CLOT|nr:HAMP domain-containing protein [Clostridium bovifaecis]
MISGVVIFSLSFLLTTSREINYIRYIAKQVKQIANQSLGTTLEVRGNDELAELCSNINFMSKELKNKFEHEREVENTKTELITNVSHDLRTPLTAIIGYLDILRSGRFNDREEEKDYLNSTYSLSIKLKTLIDELFEYTKLSGREVKLELVEVDICSILHQIVGEYTPVFESKGLKVTSYIPDKEVLVEIDIEKIVRVFDNILSNAEKYSSKPSEIIINLENSNDNVIISFSNEGENISKDKLSKIFERFYRIDMSRSSNIEGSGLGLAISKRIIELHGGEIWVESVGKIITFKIKIHI